MEKRIIINNRKYTIFGDEKFIASKIKELEKIQEEVVVVEPTIESLKERITELEKQILTLKK
jgi:polyhydroxyalkanoate synthesis regulator phasin